MRNGVSPWRWYFIGGAAAELAFSVMVMVMVMVVVMARWSPRMAWEHCRVTRSNAVVSTFMVQNHPRLWSTIVENATVTHTQLIKVFIDLLLYNWACSL